jgi:methyl-accepting chemotaxis protein
MKFDRNTFVCLFVFLATIGLAFYFDSSANKNLLMASMLGIIPTFYLLFKRGQNGAQMTAFFNELEKTSDVISGTSDQILNTTNELEIGSVEQSESLQQTATALDEIFATAQKNTDHTESASSKVAECVDFTSKGHGAVSHLVDSFSSIKEGNQEFSDYIAETNSKILEISEVINVINEKTKIINDIVFQTKLLSFNASVEAARAGEHGKGFSVVAEEVGNLANLSGSAADEISSMLEESITTVNNIVEENSREIKEILSKGTKNIENGNRAVNECQNSFESITQGVTSLKTLVNDIARASKEQTQGVEEITNAVRNLDLINQKTGLVTSQAKQVAYSVSQESGTLVELVEDLRLRTPDVPQVKKDELEHFEWNDKLELHCHEMDEEHKVLIGKINVLVSNLNEDNIDEIISSFKDLLSYTQIHFSDEEQFMRDMNYPEYEAHKQIHDNLLLVLKKFGDDLIAGKVEKDKVVAFLKNWLVTHIMGVDMKYADHYQTTSKAA